MKQKKKTRDRVEARKPGLMEWAILVLPLLALTPNFFVPPALVGMGLTNQEFFLALYITLLVGIGLWGIWRTEGARVGIWKRDWRLMLTLGALLSWQLITVIWAPSRYQALRITGIWFIFGVAFFCAVSSLRRRSAQWLFHVLTIVGLILSATILYERYLYGANMFGFFFNHGISAEILVMLLPMQMLAYFNAERRGMTTIYLGCSALAGMALLAGMRRGALLGLLVSLVAMGLMAWKGRLGRLARPRRLAAVFMLLLIAAVAGGIYKRDEVRYRFEGATSLSGAEGGLSTRLRGWLTAWEMVKAHPLAGIGQAGYPNLYGAYRGAWVSKPEYAAAARAAGPEDTDEIRSPLTHNEYLQTLVELGIVGLLLTGIFWGQIGWGIWKQLREAGESWSAGALLGLLAFGVSSFTSGFSFRTTPSPMILACVLALGFTRLAPMNDTNAPARILLPRKPAMVMLALLLIPCLLLIGRNYKVFAAQQLQGQATLRTEPLDFAYYPSDPSGNERLARRYEEVLRLDSENSGAHLGYALLLYQMKRPAEALPHAIYALRNGYSRPFAYVLVAFLHEQVGNLPEAIRVLRECAASYPLSFFVRASLVEMLRKSGEVEEMQRHQAEMYERGRRNMQSWELILRLNREAALAEATKQDLIPANELWPTLAKTLVSMRSYHYLSNPPVNPNQ